MANKAFEIQESKLRIGGLDLEAGATAIVVPGLSQAVTYFVEEVDERDGNNPNGFGNSASAVTIIDNAEYLVLSGTTPSASYTAAEYSVDELDDGEIDEINVEVAGVFDSADKTRAEAANMWATTVGNPFGNFNINDWTQIPFRPRMRADEVTNVSGASSLEELNDVQLDGPSNGQVLTWNNDQEKWENQDPSGGNVDLGGFTFDSTTMTMPEGGIITETTVGLNPTIVIGPANNDAESQALFIKGGLPPGDPVDYHLHLTTGDLEETSIILGTDEHNVRTTIVGDIEINTYNYSEDVSNTWTFENRGALRIPAGGDIINSSGQSVLGSNYSLPTASDSVLGGIKIGAGLNIDGNGVVTASGGVTTIARQDTPPSAANGTLWYNTLEGRLYIKYSDAWVDAAPLMMPAPDTDIDVASITFPDASVQTSAFSNKLVNGASELVLDEMGFLTVPASIVLSEGVITFMGEDDPGIVLGSSINSVFVRTLNGIDQYEWKFGTDGTLTLPSSSNELYTTSNSLIKSIEDIQISAGDDVGSNWIFNGNGTLTIPGAIEGPGGQGGNTVIRAPVNNAAVLMNNNGFSQVAVQDNNIYLQTSVANEGNVFNSWTFDTDGTLTFPDSISSISSLDPAQSGGINGVSLNGKDRAFIGINNESFGYSWDFRAFGGSSSGSTVKPAIQFPGGGWLQEDATDIVDNNVPVQLGSQGSITLTTKFNDILTPAEHSWVFGTDGTTTFPNGLILAPAGQSITMQSDQYSQLMYQNANVTVAPDKAINTNFFVAPNFATLDIVYRDGSSNQQTKSWLWNIEGLTFPDATVQTTAFVQGEQIFTLDTGNIDYAPTAVDFNLLFVTPAIGYSEIDPTSVTLPNGVPGQRLVIFNGYSLATLTVNPGPVGRDISGGVIAEFIYSSMDGWIPLYGTNSPT